MKRLRSELRNSRFVTLQMVKDSYVFVSSLANVIYNYICLKISRNKLCEWSSRNNFRKISLHFSLERRQIM